MKNLVKYVAMALVAFGFASCVQDLNTSPIDKNSSTGFNQDAIFTKIYATLGTTGQTGAAGSGDGRTRHFEIRSSGRSAARTVLH